MARPKIEREDAAPFYWVTLIDAELGRIRFGPFEMEDDWTIARWVEKFQEDIESLGLVTALVQRGLYGGLTIRLTGDDGTNIDVLEVPPPGL